MTLRSAVTSVTFFQAKHGVSASQLRGPSASVDVYALRSEVLDSPAVKQKIKVSCEKHHIKDCEARAGDSIFFQLLSRSHPDLAKEHCGSDQQSQAVEPVVVPVPSSSSAQASTQPVVRPTLKGQFLALKQTITSSAQFQSQVGELANAMGCSFVKKQSNCAQYVADTSFCLAFAGRLEDFRSLQGFKEEKNYCDNIDQKMPELAFVQQSHAPSFVQITAHKAAAPEDDLAQEMTHDLEMNFNKIAPFGKEDTAKELQDHAAKTQDTLVDAVENAEVAEIKRAVFRALTRLRAATIKEFDTIARLETQAIDAYNDAHHYRAENPLTHLHEDEAPVETDKLKSFH